MEDLAVLAVGRDDLDKNAFDGTAAQLQAWLDSIAYPTPPIPPADWTYGPPLRLQALAGLTSVRLSWEPPAGSPQPPAGYQVFIYNGDVCNRTTIVATLPAHGDRHDLGGRLARAR